jgi:membrane protein implicated in regulation of membrane protease activity
MPDVLDRDRCTYRRFIASVPGRVPAYAPVVDDRLVGKIGLVSDGVPAGGELTGEVMIDGQAYYALSADRQDVISKGTRVVVVEHLPPRTVVVTPM